MVVEDLRKIIEEIGRAWLLCICRGVDTTVLNFHVHNPLPL